MLSDSIGLLFRIKAEDRASDEIKKVRQTVEREVDAVEKKGTMGLAKLSGAMAGLASPAAIASTSIAAVGTVAVSASSALFSLAKSTAEAGTEIKNFSQLTGLSAESISTIKIASDQAGTSLEEFEEVWESFIEVLIEGGKGADDAKAKLKQAGIDPQKGFQDLEGSVRKAFDAVRNAKTQAEASAIAMAVFGESGLNMVKVAREMTGGFDKFKDKLSDMGLVMDRDAVEKSKDFDRELKILEATVSGVGKTFALEFMPQLSGGMNDISKILTANKSVWKEWGEYVGDIIRGVREAQIEPPSEKKEQGGLWNWWRSVGDSAVKNGYFPSDEAIKNFLLNNTGTGGLARNLSGETYAKKGAIARAAEQNSIGNLRMRDDNTSPAPDAANWKPTPSSKSSAGKTTKAVGDNFEKQFREWAGEINFRVSRVFGKNLQGKPSGSLHPAGLAGDLSIKGKSQTEIVRALAEGIKNGWRAIDERFEGAFPNITTKGANAHFEQNPRKASMFIDSRPDLYGGAENLAFLKKLDQDRLNKKGTNDDFKRFQEERERDKKAADDADKKRKESWNEHVQDKKDLWDREYEADQKVAENERKRLENEKRATEEIARMRQEVIDNENDLIDFRKEQERKVLENTLEYSRGQARVDALIVLREFDIAEAQRKKDRDNADAAEALRRAKADIDERAKTDIELKKRADDAKIELEKLYKNRLLLSEEEYQTAKDEIEKNHNERYAKGVQGEATGSWGSGAFGSFMGEMAVIMDPAVDSNEKIKQSIESLSGAYDLLKQTAGSAINSMVGASADLLTQWILTGKGSAKAFAQIAASAISNLAVQATVEAIFETAKGFAALGRYDFVSAANHFASAKMFALVAGGAALAAVGMRAGIGDSFNKGEQKFSETTSNSVNKSANSNEGQLRDESRIYRQEQDNKITRIEKALANMTVDVKLHQTATLDRGIISNTVMEDMNRQHPLRDYFRELSGDK